MKNLKNPLYYSLLSGVISYLVSALTERYLLPSGGAYTMVLMIIGLLLVIVMKAKKV